MKNIFIKIILFLLIPSFLVGQSLSSEINSDDKVYYTYAGAIIGTNFSKAKYNIWETNERKSYSESGASIPVGFLLNIFIEQFSGEFTFEQIYNFSSKIYYTKFSSSLKYIWDIDNNYYLGTGFGLYLETPPSSKKYNGGSGILLPFEFGYKLTKKSIITINIITSYGSYGIGNDNYNIISGVRFGYLYRVGAL